MAFYKHDKVNTVADDPVLGPRWHQIKNPGLDPHVLTTGSGKRANFKCPCCDHEYTAIIRRADKCPVCTGRVATPETSLAATHPEILKEWDDEFNGDLTPHSITKHTTRLIGLKCPVGHLYQTKVHLWALGNRCPYCAGKKVDKNLSLAIQYPKVAAEWDTEKNGKITPFDVLPKSRMMAWWKCACGHSWRTKVYNRTNVRKIASYTYHGSGCPVCVRTK
jgi:hypothetical protein